MGRTFCLGRMPAVAALSYFTMSFFRFSLPAETVIPYREIPLMLVLYFLGAMPEEFGWTSTLTEPLAKAYGPMKAGVMIGLVWSAWHVVPLSRAHPAGWIVKRPDEDRHDLCLSVRREKPVCRIGFSCHDQCFHKDLSQLWIPYEHLDFQRMDGRDASSGHLFYQKEEKCLLY